VKPAPRDARDAPLAPRQRLRLVRPRRCALSATTR
jgi:hypothetical protein